MKSERGVVRIELACKMLIIVYQSANAFSFSCYYRLYSVFTATVRSCFIQYRATSEKMRLDFCIVRIALSTKPRSEAIRDQTSLPQVKKEENKFVQKNTRWRLGKQLTIKAGDKKQKQEKMEGFMRKDEKYFFRKEENIVHEKDFKGEEK